MTDDIQPILDLFKRFRKKTGNNSLTAAFLTLAHMTQSREAESPTPAPPA